MLLTIALAQPSRLLPPTLTPTPTIDPDHRMMFPSLKVQRDSSSGSKIVRSNTMMVTPLERRGSLEAAELQRLLRQPPRQVDCSALKTELDAVEQRGGSDRLLKQGWSKYKYAERAQRAARTQELVSNIQELMKVALALALTLALAQP